MRLIPNPKKTQNLDFAPLEITVTSEEILADLLYPARPASRKPRS